MQTKKDEIRKTILEAAQKEFLIHGYEGASMRTIAKKANTTLGNIYHYYENKEAILEELMREPVEKVKKIDRRPYETSRMSCLQCQRCRNFWMIWII